MIHWPVKPIPLNYAGLKGTRQEKEKEILDQLQPLPQLLYLKYKQYNYDERNKEKRGNPTNLSQEPPKYKVH